MHCERFDGAIGIAVHVPFLQSPAAVEQSCPLFSWNAQTFWHCERTMLLPPSISKQHSAPSGQSVASSHSIGCFSPHDGAHAASAHPVLPQQKSSPRHVAALQATERVLPALASELLTGVSSLEHATSRTKSEAATEEEKRSTHRRVHHPRLTCSTEPTATTGFYAATRRLAGSSTSRMLAETCGRFTISRFAVF